MAEATVVVVVVVVVVVAVAACCLLLAACCLLLLLVACSLLLAACCLLLVVAACSLLLVAYGLFFFPFPQGLTVSCNVAENKSTFHVGLRINQRIRLLENDIRVMKSERTQRISRSLERQVAWAK